MTQKQTLMFEIIKRDNIECCSDFMGTASTAKEDAAGGWEMDQLCQIPTMHQKVERACEVE